MTVQPSSTATEEAKNSGFFHDGIDEALTLLCKYLGVDPGSVSWDAATETVEGDVSSVIGNILHAKFGEDWGPNDAAQAAPEPDGYFGCRLSAGLCQCNQEHRHNCKYSHWVDSSLAQPTQDGDKGEAVAAETRVMPVEPTREMWAAGANAAVSKAGYRHDIVVEAVYRAMLAAAPQPASNAGGEPDFEVAARALGFTRLATGTWVHPKDDPHFPRRFKSAEAIFDEQARGIAYPSTDSVAAELRGHLQEMVDMVAPTIKAEHRLSQGLSSALIRSRQLLASLSVSSTGGRPAA